MAEVITAAAAAELIGDGMSLLFGGSGGGHAVPEAVIVALAERYRQTKAPRGLTLASVVSLGDWDSTGFGHLAQEGLAKRVISAGFNNCPKIAALALAGEIEAYTLPQGVLSQLCRDMAGGRPGLVTPIGLGTFVDPRQAGGCQSPEGGAPLVSLMSVDGEDYLFYRCWPIDVAIVRGTTADEAGNVTMEEEAYFGEIMSMACAARRNGGRVIVQVKRLAAGGTLPGKEVKLPGALVDYIVVDPEQPQTYQTRFDPGYAGRLRKPAQAFERLPFDIRKVIARRAAMELAPGDLVNLGFGVSNGIAPVAAEEGFHRDLTLTVEQGIIGGVPAGGKDAGAGTNYEAMVDQPYQFDFYDGGGLDIAFLSFAQVDTQGNVNVSRYGSAVTGPGGFINISQGAPRVVFSGTLTAGGLKVLPDGEGGIRIEREGKVDKWLRRVEQITFSGPVARDRGQEVLYITDRAVFRLEEDGPLLIEIAKGADIDRDIRAHVGFTLQVSPDLKEMDQRLFREEAMGLAEQFRARQRHHGGSP